MMKHVNIFIFCLFFIGAAIIYWPHPNSEFVLDDYYSVAQNPLIKQPALYTKIFTSSFFDAHKSSSYLKLSYYRPVLATSYIIDYNLFGLSVIGYKWVNILIHVLNVFLIYYIFSILFEQIRVPQRLALGAACLFLVLPTHEWVVRYITGRGDSLQTFFGLMFILSLLQGLRHQSKWWFVNIFIWLILSVLTREFGYLMPLYGILIFIAYDQKWKPTTVAFGWILIGSLSFLVTYQLIPKLGSIQSLHLLYFTSIGACLFLAQARKKFVIMLCLIGALGVVYQGQYWIREETLLRHLKEQDSSDRTVAHQQLLMKYELNIKGIEDLMSFERSPIVQSMWIKRTGDIYSKQGHPQEAAKEYDRALRLNPKNIDALNALAVINLQQGDERTGIALLMQSLMADPQYAETLRLWGIYFYRKNEFLKAKDFLNQALFFDPDNAQSKELIRNIP